MRYIKFILGFLILISLGCSNNSITTQYYTLQGVVSMQSAYTPATFFDENTVRTAFSKNNLDFWIFGTNDSNKNMSNFRENIRAIGKKLKDNILIEMPMITDAESNLSTQTMLYNTPNSKLQVPVNLRELQSNICYETFHIKYNGEVNNYAGNYVKLLDSGYILAPIVCAEIIGPEWNINSGFRINVKAKQKTAESIVEAIGNRNMYFSTLGDVNMQFSINDKEMGSIIRDYKELIAEYNVSDRNTKINAVEIVTNNNEIIFAQRNLNENNISRTIRLLTNNDYAYFFLRVYFENGERATSTPIWAIRHREILINNISCTPIVSNNSTYGVSLNYNIENISQSVLDNVVCTVADSYGNILDSNNILLKKRESRSLVKDFYFDKDIDSLSITVKCGDFYQKQAVKLPKKKVGKIIFDAAHNNIFKTDFKKASLYLSQENHDVYIWDKIEQYYDYDNLSQYDILIITTPSRVVDLVDIDMKFFSRLNKYVYNGGKLILAGYNCPDTNAPIIFMNECLRVVYSSLRYYVDSRYNLSLIKDETSNFLDDENVPVFTNLYNLDKSSNVEKIYFKNPIEFRSNTGIGVTKLYGIISLAEFNETTTIFGKIPKQISNYSPAVIQNFGFGKVVVLSGINFSDYDIDNLDNKQWFIDLINYLIRTND